MRRRVWIPQRRPVFLGCEGESERAYGTLISKLRDDCSRDVHLEVVLLRPGGGDPLSLVELACRKIVENERKRDRRFAVRAILLDKDRFGEKPERDRLIAPLAARYRLRLIWQEPCHEALLLRHFEGCQTLRPSSPALAAQELRKHWPDYEKGMSAARLERRIVVESILRAASVERQLKEFLGDIGFPAG
ncbi:MAG: RloB domain-containing protein [Candidatus Binataceae bacterium]